jgi:hypothetical protein
MTEAQLATLTEREAAALRALIDKRAVYRAQGHGVAARTMGVAIWLVWQCFHKINDDKTSEPRP